MSSLNHLKYWQDKQVPLSLRPQSANLKKKKKAKPFYEYEASKYHDSNQTLP